MGTTGQLKANQVSAKFKNCIFSSIQMQKIDNGIKGDLFYSKAFLLLFTFLVLQVSN